MAGYLHICTIILHLSLSLVHSSNQLGIVTEYILRQDTFQDRVLSRYLLYALITSKKMNCAIRCTEDCRCVSFTFKKEDGLCHLFGVSFSSPSNAPLDEGIRLFFLSKAVGYIGFPCTTIADCKVALSVCNAGVCDCQIGYSFSVNDRGCVRHCTTYGTDFTAYIEMGLRDNNRFRDWNYSEKECLTYCLSQTTYQCLTVERYPADGFCTATDVTWFDVDILDRDMAAWGYLLYHRNCAI